MALSTNSKELLNIGTINSIELVSSSARVTSAKFQKALVGREGGTPETPGSGLRYYLPPPKSRFHTYLLPVSLIFHTDQEKNQIPNPPLSLTDSSTPSPAAPTKAPYLSDRVQSGWSGGLSGPSSEPGSVSNWNSRLNDIQYSITSSTLLYAELSSLVLWWPIL